MSADKGTLIRNGVISAMAFGLALVALLSPTLSEATRTATVTGSLSFVAGLWIHSGRPRRRGQGGGPTAPATAGLPLQLLPLLLLGSLACQGGSVSWNGIWPSATPINADQVQIEPRAPTGISCPAGKVCLAASNVSGRARHIDSSGTALDFGDARNFRVLSAAPGTPASGDVYYNSTTGLFQLRSGGSWWPPANDGLVPHLAGTETFTGDKTFGNLTVNGTATFPAGTVVYQVVSAGGTGTIGAATRYALAAGAWSSTEYYLAVAPRAGTARNLRCYLKTAPGGSDTVVYTVRIAGADSTLTCTSTGATATCADTTHAPSVAAGDRLSYKAVSSAGTAADGTCSFEVTN